MAEESKIGGKKTRIKGMSKKKSRTASKKKKENK